MLALKRIILICLLNSLKTFCIKVDKENDDPPAWYFAEWTSEPTYLPTEPINFDNPIDNAFQNTYPTLYPTPFLKNPSNPNNIQNTPAPTPFVYNPSWKTELPTQEPSPVEWRFSKPTPYFMNPKFSTPLPSTYPSFRPTPFELNPLFVSSSPSYSPSLEPSTAPSPWPTPVIGGSLSYDCNDMSYLQIYNNQLDTTGLPGLSIQYYHEYKVVTVYNNNNAATTYILYMCIAPDQKTLDNLGRVHANKYVKIPLKRIGFTNAYIAHALELLALQPAIRASGVPIEWLSSPCLVSLASGGHISEAYDWDTSNIDNEILKRTVEAIFSTDSAEYSGISSTIPIPEQWYNSTALETSIQLLSFISVFFNQEKFANQLISTLKNNYKCSSKTAKRNSNPIQTRKVLWCDYGGKARIDGVNRNHVIQSYAEDIWACKTCPGKECSLVRDAGGKLLDYNDFGENPVVINGIQYLESTEFMEMAIFADVWINSGSADSDFNDTIKSLLEENMADMPYGWLPLTEIPAIRQKQVYDFYLKGFYPSKQETPLEADALLQDIYSVIGNTNHNRIWLRNVFKESIGSRSVGSCTENPWEAVLLQSQDCADLVGAPFPSPKPAAPPQTSVPTPTDMKKHVLVRVASKALKERILVEKIVIGVISLVVVVVVIWYLFKTFVVARSKLQFVGATDALGVESVKMDMDCSTAPMKTLTSFQMYSKASNESPRFNLGTDLYVKAAEESGHGVVSSEHGGVISSSIDHLSMDVPTRSPPIIEDLRLPIPVKNRGIWGFLMPFRPSRNSFM